MVTTHHPILALQMGERILLVKASSKDTEKTQLSGELISIPYDLQQSVLQKLLEKYPQLNGRFLPFMMDATGYRFEGYFGLPIGLVTAGFALWLMYLGFRWMGRPETHKVWRRLEQGGSAQQAGMAIDMEMAAEGGGEKFGTSRLTSHWLVNAPAFSVGVMRLEDVVWGYQKITKRYTNGIPTGKSYHVVVFDRGGYRMELMAKKKTGPALLQSLSQRAPWMIAGFSADLEKIWKQRRAEFLEAVDQRKAQPKQSAPTPAPDATKEFAPS
jgi:hypothetical protein